MCDYCRGAEHAEKRRKLVAYAAAEAASGVTARAYNKGYYWRTPMHYALFAGAAAEITVRLAINDATPTPQELREVPDLMQDWQDQYQSRAEVPINRLAELVQAIDYPALVTIGQLADDAMATAKDGGEQ